MRNRLETFGVALGIIWRRNRSPNPDSARWGWRDAAYILMGSLTGANRMWLASQLMEYSGHADALEFAERQANDSQCPGILLLRANQYLQDEAYWLRCVNQYLASLELAPVKLSAEAGSRFSRLRADCLPLADCQEKISVIMPVFNAGSFLRHAALSILNQTWHNLELIIVDDCSTDNTWEAARALAAADGRVKLLQNEVNVGPYVSKNLALRIATGEYITGQDADDWSHPQRLQHDMGLMKSSKVPVKAVLSMMLRLEEGGDFHIYYERMLTPRGDGIRRQAYISLLIETDYLRRYLGGWDSVRFGGDGELIERAEKILGSALARLDSVGMFCLDHPGGLTSHPLHGLSRISGLSEVRQQYKRSFRAWHNTLAQHGASLPFPLASRPYAAPSAMRVPLDAVQRNIEAHQTQCQ